jgi:pimeloyl-ACP methyl ester carboxylesterase
MSRPPLVLLHGALGASSQFEPLMGVIEDRFEVHALDFEGHGGSPLKNRPCRIEHFAENVVDYLNAHAIAATAIFGHSMGGHVGMYLARFFPERVTSVFTLGTKFDWTAEIAAREMELLVAEKIKQKVPQFALQLAQRHTAAGWEALLVKMREMQRHVGQHNSLPDTEIRAIGQKVRICLGDRDKTTSIEESVRIYRLLPNAELHIFPGTPHPLEKVSITYIADALVDFFANPKLNLKKQRP